MKKTMIFLLLLLVSLSFVACDPIGTYRILSVTAPDGARLQSNWGILAVGTSFTVTSAGGYIGVYWKN